MARLTTAERAALPDRAFAYVDAAGGRRLPIVDASHVRNALSRFGQVAFESEAARDEARRRLLRAAKRHRIVPVGFIDAEIRSERTAASGEREPLPTGFVTLVMTDIEGSTGLLADLGDRYADVLEAVIGVQVGAFERFGGMIIETRADEAFAVFRSPHHAVDAAVAIQTELANESPSTRGARVRVGIHAGYPTVRQRNYIGMAVHTTARVSDAAHGGQIVVTADTREALTGMTPAGVRFRGLGTHRLRGIPGETALFQVLGSGLQRSFPDLRL